MYRKTRTNPTIVLPEQEGETQVFLCKKAKEATKIRKRKLNPKEDLKPLDNGMHKVML